ncbi:MAG: DeoR/GlpR family DNA-binding transcription regulator [Oscillospiraceae bacterium]|nr:DeoR/GlpR family DNA-binding transcription regulator [Oscillospiraceae bacterium]
MIREQRIEYILREIQDHGIVSIAELTRVLDTSRSTIHRDLEELEALQKLKCVRGGAVAPTKKTAHEPSFMARQSRFAEEKQRIAQAALDYIQENETILLDSGTTIYELSKLLANASNLYIATNDLHSAMALSNNPKISLVVLGGSLRSSHYTLNGVFTEDVIRQIHADTTFLSVDAVDFGVGFMGFSVEEIPTKRLMIKAAQKVIVLCDHSKFESVAFVNICAIEQVDMIITGKEIRPEYLKQLEELGVQVLTV